MAVTTLGTYEILRGLGRGASSSVYLACDRKTGKYVALKVLSQEYASDPSHRRRFQKEAHAISVLSHPNIVGMHDSDPDDDNKPFLAMDLIGGSDVGSFCREHGKMPISALLALGIKLSDALEHAHQSGILHRDLKPDNVFLDEGRAVLVDFGIAAACGDDSPLGEQRTTSTVIGTPGFISPEQLRGRPLDPRADIFSLAALLYYLGSDQLPYQAASPYELLGVMRETRPTPIIELDGCTQLSPSFSRLLQRSLAFDPAIRPSTVTEFRAELGAIFAERSFAGKDATQVLTDYCNDPETMRTRHSDQAVGLLLKKIGTAVEDDDHDTEDELRMRLADLYPGHPETELRSHASGSWFGRLVSAIKSVFA